VRGFGGSTPHPQEFGAARAGVGARLPGEALQLRGTRQSAGRLESSWGPRGDSVQGKQRLHLDHFLLLVLLLRQPTHLSARKQDRARRLRLQLRVPLAVLRQWRLQPHPRVLLTV